MRRLLYACSLLSLFFACKNKYELTDADKESIDFYIQLHDNRINTDIANDSIQRATEMKILMIRAYGKPKGKELNAFMRYKYTFYNYNDSLYLDRTLTYNKLIYYCKEHHFDPMTVVKSLEGSWEKFKKENPNLSRALKY